MKRPLRGNRLRSESGAIGAGTAIGVALLGVFVYLVLAATEGDPAHYGTVTVPGTAQIELPEGETDIFYREGIESGSAVSLVTPDDLDYTVTDSSDISVETDSRGGDPEEVEGGETRKVGAVFAPADGVYTVEVESDEAAQRITPELTFGQSPLQAIEARFEEIVDALKGPLGIVVVAILFVLFMLPRLRRSLRRSNQS